MKSQLPEDPKAPELSLCNDETLTHRDHVAWGVGVRFAFARFRAATFSARLPFEAPDTKTLSLFAPAS